MKLKTFCSLTMIPTLILILLLLSSLDNYSIQTDTYGQPIDDASLNQSNTDSVLINGLICELHYSNIMELLLNKYKNS